MAATGIGAAAGPGSASMREGRNHWGGASENARGGLEVIAQASNDYSSGELSPGVR